MAEIAYVAWNPSPKSLTLIGIANQICAEYTEQGYDLTLRQLYYQFVARDYLPNNQRSYKNLGTVIDNARKAGYLDWNYIVDRTRNLQGYRTYDSPAKLIEDVWQHYHVDLWEGQGQRVEVWVEKEALAGVIGRAALAYGVDYFSCRGYVSQSELHAASHRHQDYEERGQNVTVIHLGDHDPSGIDMTRDMEERLHLYGASTKVQRIALNIDQIAEYQPPPNPAKLTDSRAKDYISLFGRSSWELDALDPSVLNKLIQDTIVSKIDDTEHFNQRVALQEKGQDQLISLAENWDYVVQQLD